MSEEKDFLVPKRLLHCRIDATAYGDPVRCAELEQCPEHMRDGVGDHYGNSISRVRSLLDDNRQGAGVGDWEES